MAERLAAALMLAALRGGEYEAALLDRPRAVQHVPMGLAGRRGERRRNRQERGPRFGKRAIEGGESQIVADRDADSSPRQFADDRELSGAIVARFAVALAIA